MSRVVVVSLGLCGLLVSSPVSAQLTEGVSAEATGDAAQNIDAVPGVLRVSAAGDLDPGLALNVTAGYGYTEDVLELSDTHHRMRASAAATYRPTTWLAAGLRLDGRYDRHSADMLASDDGWVGEARLLALASRRLGHSLWVGGQITAWVPGIDGVSGEVRGLVTTVVGPARVHGNLGFRLDRSADSVDDVESLSRFDRLALGVSDSNAVLAGIGAEIPLGKVDLLLEGTWDLLVGADAPSAIESPIRVAAGVRFPLTSQHQIAAMLEGSVGRVPFVDAMQPLVPVEPLVGLHIIVSQRPRARASLSTPRERVDETPPIVVTPTKDLPPETVGRLTPRKGLSSLRGVVRDARGEPIAGALVNVATRELLTDKKGEFSTVDLMPGELSFDVDAKGYSKTSETVTLVVDKVLDINVILTTQATGSLVGAVQTFDGKPAAAKIRIEPGGHRTESNAAGRFDIKLPAGTYTVTAELTGYAARSMKVVLTVPGPVVIVNLDLRKQ